MAHPSEIGFVFASFARLITAVALVAIGATAVAAQPAFQPGRGISMDQWVTWPAADTWSDPVVYRAFPEWMNVINDDDLAALSRAGIDTIRLPIEPAFLLYDWDNAERLGVVLAQTKIAMDRLLAEGFKIIVDLHTIERNAEIALSDTKAIEGVDEVFAQYLEMLAVIAAALRHYDPQTVALEIFNEPTLDCTQGAQQALWASMLRDMHGAARKA
ncbi:MAG: cellulase family glycosylhydrolase, partial [Pseudomonadota bacterium]